MSKVSISVSHVERMTAALKLLRPLVNRPLSELKAALQSGDVLYERELFLNDFAEVAETMRAIVDGLGRLDATLVIRESGDEITGEVLLNILHGSEEYGV